MKARYLRAAPYAKDALNLPVASVASALPFYQTIMGFTVESESSEPVAKALLVRDEVRIGLAENGGDPSNEGCFFEVDNVEAAFQELKARGLKQDQPNFRNDTHGATTYRVFFVIAPDGLCYCLGQRQ